jgi:hypothetical protein
MIFISYRRSDSESVVGRIYSELKKHFPTKDVFLDHDSIPLGKPFADIISERLASSKFALVLIGPQWCQIKEEKTGQRRLDDPNDFVRLEVETALATPGIDVIPLWVMRATTLPEEVGALPASLQALFKNNGMSIRPVPDETSDLQRLISRLTRQADNPSSNAMLASTDEQGVHRERFGKHSYDWSSEVGEGGFEIIRPGLTVLYEEHSLDRGYDEAQYRKNRQLRIPNAPFSVSPRGFMQLAKGDWEWLDPRDRNRRICMGTISEVLPDGRVRFSGAPIVIGDIVDVLVENPLEVGGAVDETVNTLLKNLNATYPGDRAKAARDLGQLGAKARRAVSALAKAIKDSSGPVRNAAAFALRAIGSDEALAVLADYERR